MDRCIAEHSDVVTSDLLLSGLVQEATANASSDISSAAFATHLDTIDPLKSFRSEFYFPSKLGAHHEKEDSRLPSCLGGSDGSSVRYFCGNSLGLQHRDVEVSIMQEVQKWRSQAVEGHFHEPNPWFEVDEILRSDMASIVGGQRDEVVIMNSLTANLHLLLSAFYKPQGVRTKLLSEAFPFPSDTHAFVSQVRSHGLDPDVHYVTIGSLEGPGVINTETFLRAIEVHGDEAAVLVLGAIHFLTGQCFDMMRIVDAAHKKGILVGIDAAHAVGNVPLHFHDWNVDFACWCTYKYLNGGPGNIGGLFVHARHDKSSAPSAGLADAAAPLRGWWGHRPSRKPFLIASNL